MGSKTIESFYVRALAFCKLCAPLPFRQFRSNPHVYAPALLDSSPWFFPLIPEIWFRDGCGYWEVVSTPEYNCRQQYSGVQLFSTDRLSTKLHPAKNEGLAILLRLHSGWSTLYSVFRRKIGDLTMLGDHRREYQS